MFGDRNWNNPPSSALSTLRNHQLKFRGCHKALEIDDKVEQMTQKQFTSSQTLGNYNKFAIDIWSLLRVWPPF